MSAILVDAMYNQQILILLIAIVAGSMATWLMRRFAWRFNIVNAPNPIIPQHTKPVAYLGGVGIFIGLIMTIWICRWWPSSALNIDWKILVPASMFLVLGVVDDLKVFSAQIKFAWQVLLAILAVYIGNAATFTGFYYADLFISACWILILVNAFNFTDVCDGLLGGLSAILFLALAYISPTISPFMLALAGCCIGFLIFNRPPASIYLGDAGSHLLGFLAAALTLKLSPVDSITWEKISLAWLLVGVSLFELIFITSIRIYKGIPWWKGSPDHFSLRLQAAGFTKLQTDMLAWTCAMALSFAAINLANLALLGEILLFFAVILFAYFAARYLLKHEVR